jgi:hypothetical protein
MVFAPLDGAGAPFVRAQLDLVGLARAQYAALLQAVARGADVEPERAVVSFSHSHSAGLFTPDRESLPGGTLIRTYLEELLRKLTDVSERAMRSLASATLTYATGRCAMNASRDYWDAERRRYVCGFNPDSPADETLIVARITGATGQAVGTLVHYGCHPTTLAWENSLLSPDYVGALRERVAGETGAPCVFSLGACGDLGPRRGYSGDPALADHNGRQLAFAALSLLEAMPSPATDFAYAGPVISGATLGTWSEVPLSDERRAATTRFSASTYSIDLPLKGLPERASLETEVNTWEARRRKAEALGDDTGARDCGARSERARRWLGRIADLPPGGTYPVRLSVLRLGDAVWVTCAGEPYSALAVELRRRFPDMVLLVTPLSGEMQVAYMLPRELYGKGLYQEEPSPLAPGCLEDLIEAIAVRIEEHLRQD